MCKKKIVAPFLFLTFLFATQGFSAKRVVQFGAITGTEFSSAEITSSSGEARCVLTLMNTGDTNQKLTAVTFFNYDPSKGTTATETSPDQMMMRGKTSGEKSDTNCINVDVKPGAVCVLKHHVKTYSLGGKYGVCAGKVEVEDSDASQPGSVIMSGSIFMVAESRVVAGQLMGALYASGTPNFGTTGTIATGVADYNKPSGAPNPADPDPSYNMNIYCSKICKAHSGWTDPACEAACGAVNGATGGKFSSTDLSGSPWSTGVGIDNALGYLDFLKTGETGPIAPEQSATNQKYFIRTANPFWGGGMVHEMIIGPFTTICSGNDQYFDEGGLDFRHGNSTYMDAYFMTADRTADSNYLERLYCGHHHFQSSLISEIGLSYPFTINGGLAF